MTTNAISSAASLLDSRTKNEREILRLIRQKKSLPKAEISALTGLSAQSATVIIKKLESDNLVKRYPAVRGSVGQPKVPFGLNAQGAFGVGLKIGRRSFDMTLLDLAGNVRASLHEKIDYPTVEHLLSFSQRGLAVLTQQLNQQQRSFIRGIGVAMPFELWNWAEEAGAPSDALQAWRNIDIQSALYQHLGLPVFISNDAIAACGAEMAFGNKSRHRHFLYIFIGTFLGGGLVINNQLFTGKSGNAGAIGSLPFFSLNSQGEMSNKQLISQSSLYLLERKLTAAGFNGMQIYDNPEHWSFESIQQVPNKNSSDKVDDKYQQIITDWILQASEGIAYAAHCGFSMLDIDSVVIDGAMPSRIKKELVKCVDSQLNGADLRGVIIGSVCSGTVGSKAQSIGSANLPLIANYY